MNNCNSTDEGPLFPAEKLQITALANVVGVEFAISMLALSRHFGTTSRVVAVFAHFQSVAALIGVLAILSEFGCSGLVFFANFTCRWQSASFSCFVIGIFST